MSDLSPDTIPKPPWRVIAEEVAAKHGFTFSGALKRRREQARAWCRQAIMYRLRVDLNMGTKTIGRFLKRHHTTVMHGILAHCERTGQPLPLFDQYGRRVM